MSSRLKLSGLTETNGLRVHLENYVTLDWDAFSPDDLRKFQGAIRRNSHIRHAWVRRSSAKGHHVIMDLDDAYDDWVLFFLRRAFGDDLNRLRWDKDRGDPQGVLFDYKRGQFSGEWRRFK